MSVYAITYAYTSDAAKLDAFRPEHRAFLAALNEAGSVIASGPLAASDAAGAGALILVDAADDDAVTTLLDGDPFRREGLIAERTVRQWLPVIGSLGR